MKRVLILLHDGNAPQGSLEELLATHHIAYDILNVVTEPLPDPDHYAAFILLGGEQHVYETENYPYLMQEKVYIQQLIARNLPILGICLGGQLLASALEAPVRQHHLTEIGFYDVQITPQGQADPLFAGFTDYQKVFHWHQDVFELPSGATLLATHPNARQQAFRYGSRAYGIQYHIELDEHILNSWLYDPSLKQSIVETIGHAAYQSIEQEREVNYPIYRTHTRMLFENFLSISNLIN